MADPAPPQDKSKITYCCIKCGVLPCICVRIHNPLTILTFQCKEPGCSDFYYTINKLQEHYLDRHSSIVPMNEQSASVNQSQPLVYQPSINGRKLYNG